MVRVVLLQKRAPVCLARERLAIGNRARGIGGTIGAVRTGAENDDAIQPGDLDGGGQNEFLIAAAEPAAFDRDGSFTARDDAGRSDGGGAR